MLAAQRQSAILEEARRSGAVRVSDLATLLSVSEMTIRRDIDTLSSDGKLAKVHGGATLADGSSTYEPGFAHKSGREQPEKEQIARAAAEIVRPGMAIGLTAGTTTWTLARHLTGVDDITVVTNSISVATVFHEARSAGQTVVLTGGVRTPSDALVGPVAVQSLRSMHLDVLFMGVHGIETAAGLTTPNMLEADTNREFARAARRLVVPVDHTKVGVVGMSTIVGLDEVDLVVTDAGIPPEDADLLREHVTDVVVAGSDGE